MMDRYSSVVAVMEDRYICLEFIGSSGIVWFPPGLCQQSQVYCQLSCFKRDDHHESHEL